MYQTFYRSSEYLNFPLIALGIFAVFFVGTFVWAYWPSRDRGFSEQAMLPLAEDLDGQR